MIRKAKMIVAIILTLLLIVNIALFAMGKIDMFIFWITIIVCAVFAYIVLPRIKKLD